MIKVKIMISKFYDIEKLVFKFFYVLIKYGIMFCGDCWRIERLIGLKVENNNLFDLLMFFENKK